MSSLTIQFLQLLDFIRSNIYLSILFLAWSFFWKGKALWKAAKNNSIPWFIALLLINTLGILEILYIFVFGREVKTEKKSVRKTK